MSEGPLPDAYIHQDEFPARLRQAVIRFGGSSAVGRAIGRSEGAVRKWLRGESEPNVSDLRAICRVCGVDVAWLVAGEPTSPPNSSEIRENQDAYGPMASPPLDDDLLERVLAAMEEEPYAGGAAIPVAKRAAAAVTLYGLFRSAGAIDRKAVARVVKLAI